MTAPQCEQPATTAGAAPVPMTLRAIAAWLETHPEFTLGGFAYEGEGGQVIINDYSPSSGKHLARLVRQLGGHWTKHVEDDYDLFDLTQQIAPGAIARLVATRSQVCERVVTGTAVIEEPDPEALAAVPKVEREVETYEWRCDPILSGRDSA